MMSQTETQYTLTWCTICLDFTHNAYATSSHLKCHRHFLLTSSSSSSSESSSPMHHKKIAQSFLSIFFILHLTSLIPRLLWTCIKELQYFGKLSYVMMYFFLFRKLNRLCEEIGLSNIIISLLVFLSINVYNVQVQHM